MSLSKLELEDFMACLSYDNSIFFWAEKGSKTPSTQLVCETFVAGTFFHDAKIIQALSIGAELLLEAEPDNPYDPHAIAISSEQGVLGYIPKERTQELHQRLKAGEQLEVEVSEREGLDIIIKIYSDKV